jgi:hypothetical protein
MHQARQIVEGTPNAMFQFWSERLGAADGYDILDQLLLKL